LPWRGALTSAPKILLIDEASVGLAPVLVKRTIEKIQQLNERYQLTVLTAEQNFNQAVRIGVGLTPAEQSV
jgi:branched-chain amino acid transport system ATP-binding protein